MAGIVLVVDDSRLSPACVEPLESDGHQVWPTPVGEAWATVKARDGSVVIISADHARHLLEDRPSAEVGVVVVGTRQALDSIVPSLGGAPVVFLVEPFDATELQARVRSLVLAPATEEPAVRLESCRIDLTSGLVTRDHEDIELTSLENRLVTYMASRAGTILSRAQLLADVWGYHAGMNTRTVDMNIRRLRTKIEADPTRPRHLRTIRGQGYQFDPIRAVAIAPPTGQVTFVVTAVPNLPMTWDRSPKRMRAALAVHDSVVWPRILMHQGSEVERRGEGFIVAFASPINALAWCEDVQQQLMLAQWPSGIPSDPGSPFRGLRVAMGIHLGEPDYEWESTTQRMRYAGAALHSAKGIAAAAHGGQILISEATWTQVHDQLDDWVCEDLGPVHIRELSDPIHVRQLLPRALAQRTFPPIRAAQIRRTNLSPSIIPFIGRQADMRALDDRLAAGDRLITVLGTGGIGKTALVQRYGHARFGGFVGGAWFCDLTEAQGIEAICAALGGALELPMRSTAGVEQVASALRGRGHMLLILDNFEGVIEHASSTIATWLSRAPQLRILVTSRIRLQLAEEFLLELGPLSVEEALVLFVDRAQRADRDCLIDAPIIRDIVAQVDCLPLAIELAAARVGMLPLEELRTRLASSFDLVRSQRRDGPKRHNSLTAMLDWSWDLLEPWARGALAQCAVFHGGFTLESAEAVIELDRWPNAPPVIDALQTLRDSSLLRKVSAAHMPVRFGMFASVQAYASARLSAMEPEVGGDARTRHRHHFAQFGTPAAIAALDGHGGIQLRRRLSAEIDNLNAAIKTALETQDAESAGQCAIVIKEIQILAGTPAAPVAQLEQVMNLPQLQPAHRMALHRVIGRSGIVEGAFELATHHLEQAQALAHSQGDDRNLGRITALFGNLYLAQGAITDAETKFETANQIAHAVRDLDGQAAASCLLGNLEAGRGNFERAQHLYEQAVDGFRALGNRRSEAIALGGLGANLTVLGHLDNARVRLQSALALAREIGDRVFEGPVTANLGNLFLDSGDIASAKAAYESAAAIHREVGDRRGTAVAHGNLGDLYLSEGRTDEALEHLREAVAICHQIGFIAEGAFLGSLGEATALAGDPDQGHALLDQGEAILQQHGFEYERGKLLCRRVRMLLAQSQRAPALAALEQANRILAASGSLEGSKLGREVVELRVALERD